MRRTSRRSTARRIGPECVAITAGCNQAFFVAIAGAREGRRRGDAADALVLQPQDGARHARHRGGAPSLPRGGRLRARRRRMHERLLTDRVRAIVLVTPNNPTGAVYPPATIDAFAKLCAERGIALVLDETYRDFIDPDEPPHGCFADDGLAEYGDPALQLLEGLLHSRPSRRRHRRRARRARRDRQNPRYAADLRAARAAARAALGDSGARRLARRQPRRDKSRAQRPSRCAIAELDGWSIGSIGAYFAYVAHPLRRRERRRCLRPARGGRGVLCLPGSYFGPAQEGFLRVAFANVGVEGIGRVPERLGAT